MKVVTIGRSAGNNDIIVNDVNVSRNHLQIIQDDNGNYSLVDLGSTNGTYVNGRRISGEVYLQPGDQVMIGSTVLPWQSYFAGAPAPQPVMAERTAPRVDAPKRNLTWLYIVIGGVLLLLIAGIVLWLVFGDKPESSGSIVLPADTALINKQNEFRQTQEETDASIIALEQALQDFENAVTDAKKEEAKKNLDNEITKAINKAGDAQAAANNAQAAANRAQEAVKRAGDAVEALKGDSQVKKFAKNAQTELDKAKTAATNAKTAADKAQTAADQAKQEASKDNVQAANREVKIALTQYKKAKEEELAAETAATEAERAAVAAEQVVKEKKDGKTVTDTANKTPTIDPVTNGGKKPVIDTNNVKQDTSVVDTTTNKPVTVENTKVAESLNDQFNALYKQNRMQAKSRNESYYKQIFEEMKWGYGEDAQIKNVSMAKTYLKSEFDASDDDVKLQIIKAMKKALYPQNNE